MGKTYIWNTIISKFRSEKHIVFTVALSRIASLLLLGGKIAHSVFKISLQHDETTVCHFDERFKCVDLFRKTMLIV